MTLRAIPSSYSIEALERVDWQLDTVEREHSVHILIAIESGSRAWGFPSPDSDYDGRFIYVRRPDDYLSPWASRDVIEAPLVGDMDVNGWDLGKALKLMLKGNAVIVEWLMSPIVYRGDAHFRSGLLALASAHAEGHAIARHYLHLGLRQRNTYFADGKPVALKKIFYALRPAVALRWLRLHPTERLPPMHFPTLMTQSDPPPNLAILVEDLLARKAVTNELGKGPLPEQIKSFIDGEFESAREAFPEKPAHVSPDTKAQVSAFYRRWVMEPQMQARDK